MVLVTQRGSSLGPELRDLQNQRPIVETAVLALDAVKKALDGKNPKKVIVVPQRIVNVVV